MPRAPSASAQAAPRLPDAAPPPLAALTEGDSLGSRLASCCSVVTNAADVLAQMVEASSAASGRDQVRPPRCTPKPT